MLAADAALLEACELWLDAALLALLKWLLEALLMLERAEVSFADEAEESAELTELAMLLLAETREPEIEVWLPLRAELSDETADSVAPDEV